MSMPSAARVSDIASFERVETCPLDGAPFVPSRGCRVCAFDAKYDNEPLGFCADCGAGLDGRCYACGACLHAALLADALTSVARLTGSDGHPSAFAVTAFAREAPAGSGDDAEVRGRLLHEALVAEARSRVQLWTDGMDAA